MIASGDRPGGATDRQPGNIADDWTRRDMLLGLGGVGAGLGAWGIGGLPARALAADPLAVATHILSFDAPARSWLEAIPVGNGRIGAMVFGGIAEERIQLNHIELWSGRPAADDPPAARDALAEVRRLLFAGRYAEANALAQARMMVPMNTETFGSYQMLGDLLLSLDHPGDAGRYRRELDLGAGEARVDYTIAGHRYTRTILASFPDQILSIHLTTTAPQGLSFTARLRRSRDATVAAARDHVAMRGRPVPSGTAFAADLGCVAQGGVRMLLDDGWQVTGARSATLLLSAATDLLQADPGGRADEAMRRARGRGPAAITARHRQDHRALFDAVSLDLGVRRSPDTSAEMLLSTADGGDERALACAYFDFGRYLLIASSRPGSLPANLQGLWADGFSPPWSADYHININLQMNYWPAEVCGLGALHEPLFAHAERLIAPGARTARIIYGCRGAAAHYTSNPWGHTAPDGQLQWGMWPDGLAWLSLHFWEHYLFSGDIDFLRARGLPMLKTCALFTLDYLVAHPRTGMLVAGPATSPENSYRLPGGGGSGEITMGPAMSQSMAFAVLSRCRAAAALLGTEAALAARCDRAIAQLQRLRIGADGRIMEWPEPFEETDRGHRHVSHLFGLFPGYEIDPATTSALADAARKTLAARLAGGGGQTGWSAAWLAMFRARLGEGDAARSLLTKLFRESTAPNLFDTHPSGGEVPLFQIDGNLGATAAIVEMLLQSHEGRLRILPALPGAWPDGRLTGARARGGVSVDIVWRKGVAREVTLRPSRDVDYAIVPPPGQRLSAAFAGDGAIEVAQPLFALRRGRVYRLVFDGSEDR
ncbi:glycoside hydrolase family 95 protein [Sphingomonas sp.]|jgi:alpha-L-fucosidase 2|uniref:glycoside hydrolase family 95 protein n=1 Tax=Sphingomonas sp. TaxID=28214 RepID=UPI002EDA7E4D